jgi:hypothetical protein
MNLDKKPFPHSAIYPPSNALSSSMREVVIRTPSPPLSYHCATNFGNTGNNNPNDDVVGGASERCMHEKQFPSSSSSSSSSSVHSSVNLSSHASSSNSNSPSSTQIIDPEEEITQKILPRKQKEINVENSVQQQCVFVLEPNHSAENVSEICIQCCNEEQRKEWYDAINTVMEYATNPLSSPHSIHPLQLGQVKQQIYKCGWLLRDGKERWFVLDVAAAKLYWKKDKVHAIKKMDGVIQGFKKWIDLRNYRLVQRIIYTDSSSFSSSSSFSHSSAPPSPSLYQSLENTKSTIRRAFSRVASLRGVVEKFKEEKSVSDSSVEKIYAPLAISSPSQFQHISTLGSIRKANYDIHASKSSKSPPQSQVKLTHLDGKNSFRASEKEDVDLVKKTSGTKEGESKISQTRQDMQVLQAQVQTLESELKQLKIPKPSTTPYGAILVEDGPELVGNASAPMNRKSHVVMRNSDRYCENEHDHDEHAHPRSNEMNDQSNGGENLIDSEIIYDRVESLRMNKETPRNSNVSSDKQNIDGVELLKQPAISNVEYGDLPRNRTVLEVMGGDKITEIDNANPTMTACFDSSQNMEQPQNSDVSTSNGTMTNKISPRKSRTNSRSARKKSQTKHIS